jgi:hypothetical protein
MPRQASGNTLNSPEAAVRERVAGWRPVLLAGGRIEEMLTAGRAMVKADIRTGVLGDMSKGVEALEQRLVDAVKAAQDPSFRTEVRVRPDEMLGLNAVALVLGPESD